MIGYRYDDGSRAAAGYRGKTGDCVVRAIAICAREDYSAVYRTMAEHMKRNGYATRERNRKAPRRRGQLNARRVQDRVLEAYGFRKVRLPSGERPTYTEAHRSYGDCIVGTTKHVAAIVGGVPAGHLRRPHLRMGCRDARPQGPVRLGSAPGDTRLSRKGETT